MKSSSKNGPARRIKARKMWANIALNAPVPIQISESFNDAMAKRCYLQTTKSIPVAVLDLSDLDAMIAQIVIALRDAHFKRGGKVGQFWYEDAIAVLQSLGLLPQKRKGRG